MLIRFALASVLIVLVTAAATATAGLLEVRKVTNALSTGQQLDLGDEIAATYAGKPQTLLLIGSDRRWEDIQTGAPARSDTLILVRLDPQQGEISVLSVPRDLKVSFQPGRFDKINAAYAVGGPRLALKTVKDLLGIEINHVITANFGGFSRAVDRIGCVYVDIDRRYYHVNDGTAAQNYASIDIQPGYQRLCGADALDYVRFRHEDNDFVRAARQQDFLRQAKAQVGVKRLFNDREELLRIIGHYTDTDIRGEKEVLRLIKLAIAASDSPVRQVTFQVVPTEASDSFVVTTPAMIQQTVSEFLGTTPPVEQEGEGEGKGEGEGEAGEQRHHHHGSKSKRGHRQADSQLEDFSLIGQQQAVKLAGQLPFPVYYPELGPRSAIYIGEPRAYTLPAHGKHYAAYRLVIKKGYGEFYGVQGTNWLHPPILEGVSERRKLCGRTLSLYRDGDRLRLVAWRSRGALYWVSNTLQGTLKRQEMLDIACSLRA